jgi:hypothetical protein
MSILPRNRFSKNGIPMIRGSFMAVLRSEMQRSGHGWNIV